MYIFKQNIETYNLKENDVVLDIETSGVHRDLSHIVTVGLLFSSSTDDNFIQLTAEKDEEKKLLDKLYDLINNKNIITYNGKNFDLPFINSRYVHHNLLSPDWDCEFDIFRFLIANRAITDISMFSLQEIEKYLSIERFENFELEADQAFYAQIEDENLKKISLHNKYDVINTEKVLSLVNKIEEAKNLYFDLNGESLNLKIENLSIDKDILEINLSSSSDKLSSFVASQTWLDWEMSKVKIKIKLSQGFISKDTLAQVFIQEKTPYIKNLSTYKLRENILLIRVENRYILKNIKNLIENIIKEFIK